MKKDFSISNDKVVMNFTVKYCDTMEKIINSSGFRTILKAYINKIKGRNSNIYRYISVSLPSNNKSQIEDIIKLFNLLTVMKSEDILEFSSHYYRLLSDKDMFISFIEDLYSYWRKLERYALMQSTKVKEGLAAVSFLECNEKFTNLVISLYRKIEESVLGYKPKIYRQLPVGSNAGIIVNRVSWQWGKEYEFLGDIPFIDTIILETPYITYPKRNTRDGIFEEVYENPLKNCNINKDHWMCYPAKVGELLAFVYFHRDFMAHGVTLCNLFEIAKEEEYVGERPDIIYMFGVRDYEEKAKTNFYMDEDNEIIIGYASHSEEIDYFGYMKKMILTLHNIIMIKKGYLPIHGAMVNIVMKNGKEANVVIVGDSGAGKSESLEAFRSLSEQYIRDMTIVFDDMGVLKIHKDGDILGYGTEIGAFVRLDDLDQGYAFKEIDRSIFMNPDKTNARLVMPVSSYKDIMKGYAVDLILYANNYTLVHGKEKSITYFDKVEEAISVFKEGARVAKGTTTEKGLVNSYFANPFGPAQKVQETDVILDEYFKLLMESGVKVGEIKTCLAISGMEKKGPYNAAIELFKIIDNLKK